VAAAALAVVEGQCDAAKGDPDCPGVPLQSNPAAVLAAQEAATDSSEATALVVESEAAAAATEAAAVNVTAVPREELGAFRVGFVLALLGFVILWIGGTIKFALDGSLPARLALWGLLPEAYAAISVRSVIALIRLKKNPTPVVVLRNCVTDAGAAELAGALRVFGKQAGLEALELPHNLEMGEAGLQHLASMALCAEGPQLQEIDISYNPQLGDGAVELLLPLLRPKASQVNTLRIADCSLTVGFIQQLAEKMATSKLRVLDISCNALAGAGEALASLCEAPVLEELALACCGLRPDDVEAVADQLPYTSLRSLQLGGNGFGGAGLRALAQHLPASQIDELGLEGNDIEAADLSDLGQAWAKRPFSRLRLSRNRMSQAEVSRFIRTLRSIHG